MSAAASVPLDHPVGRSPNVGGNVCLWELVITHRMAGMGALQNVRLRAVPQPPQSAMSHRRRRPAKLGALPTSKLIRVRSGFGRRSGVRMQQGHLIAPAHQHRQIGPITPL